MADQSGAHGACVGDEYVLAQGGGAVFGQDEQALIGLNVSAHLHLSAFELCFDLPGDGQATVGTVAHAKGLGLHFKCHVDLAQR